MIFVSSCLLGIDCKYNGKNNKNDKVLEFIKDYTVIPICPEQLGGLETPRLPAEIIGDKVINSEGKDVTKNFKKGANEVLKLLELYDIEFAILKNGSPSCGSSLIYDGTFSNIKINGEGITVRELRKKGIKVVSEEDI